MLPDRIFVIFSAYHSVGIIRQCLYVLKDSLLRCRTLRPCAEKKFRLEPELNSGRLAQWDVYIRFCQTLRR